MEHVGIVGRATPAFSHSRCHPRTKKYSAARSARTWQDKG